MESKAAEGEAEKGLEDGMQSKENGLIGLQSELQSRLAHAFDVSQMFVIFQQMIGEIEEQGRQSDALKSEMRGLRAKLSEFEKLPAKLDEMRGKVRELEQQNQVQRQSEGRGSFDTMYQRFLGEEKEKEEKEIEIKKEEEEGITSSVPIAASAASPLMIIDEVEQTVFVIEAAEELMPQLPSELKRQPSVVKEMLDSLIFSNSLRNMNITTTTSKDEGGDDNKTERRLEMAGELRKNLSSEGMETSNITLLSGEAKGDREEKAATSQFDDDSAATKEEEADETTSPPQTEALSEGTSEQKKTRRVSFAPLPSLQINSPSSSSSSMMTEGEKTTFQTQTHTQGGMFYRGQMTPSRHQLPAKASSSSSLLAPASSSSSSYSVLSPTTAAATTQLLSRHSQLAGLELNSSTREGSGVQPALVVGSFAPILSPTRAPTSSSSSRSPFSFSPDMNTRQHQRVSSQLQGELADGLKVNLVPLDDVNFMVVVTEEDVRLLKEVQEVTGEEDSAVERRLFLMEGLKRAGKVVQHVERFKRSRKKNIYDS